MNDIELLAVATLVQAQIASKVAENQFRAARQEYPAYDEMGMLSPEISRLETELKRREVI